MDARTELRRARRVVAGLAEEAEDETLAVEEPLEIRLNGESVVVTMRTPGDDEDLALGFLHGEGVLAGSAGGVRVDRLDRGSDAPWGSVVDVVAPEPLLLARPRARGAGATSACGVCGVATLSALHAHFPRLASDLRVASLALLGMVDGMREGQSVFDRTGGIHAAAFFAPSGRLEVLREDVGRHNAVDKVVGAAVRAGALPASRSTLLVSGRAGYEILQKAASAGVPVVAAVGAPSSLAVRVAEEAGVTLVGFLRDDRFNVYAHPERITHEAR